VGARVPESDIFALRLQATPRVWRLPDGPFGMWAFDPSSGEILAANPSACRIYGYALDDLRALSIDEVCRSPLGSLLDLELPLSPQDETVWHRRRDHSTFQTDVSLVANTLTGDYSVTVLVHPLILSGGCAVSTSALRDLTSRDVVREGPFPSLRAVAAGLESEPRTRALRQAAG